MEATDAVTEEPQLPHTRIILIEDKEIAKDLMEVSNIALCVLVISWFVAMYIIN